MKRLRGGGQAREIIWADGNKQEECLQILSFDETLQSKIMKNMFEELTALSSVVAYKF